MRNLLFVAFLSVLAFATGLPAQDPAAITIPDASGNPIARLVEVDGALGFTLRRKDGSWTEATVADYRIGLRYATFDPLTGEPAVPASLAARPDSELFLVQYHTQGLQAYRDVISGVGGQCLLFLANYGNVYRMDASLAAEVQKLPFVRAVAPFHPANKLEQPQLAAVTSDDAGSRWLEFSGRALSSAGLDPAVVGDQVHDAILAGQFWLFTDEAWDEAISRRAEEITTRRQPTVGRPS